MTLRRGRKVGTEMTPGGDVDLCGVSAVVCDEPQERLGSVDGKVRGRVTVRPVLPSACGPRFGMPLDVPLDNLRREKADGYFEELGDAVKTTAAGVASIGRALFRGIGGGRLRRGERSRTVYRNGKSICVDSDDPSEISGEE